MEWNSSIWSARLQNESKAQSSVTSMTSVRSPVGSRASVTTSLRNFLSLEGVVFKNNRSLLISCWSAGACRAIARGWALESTLIASSRVCRRGKVFKMSRLSYDVVSTADAKKPPVFTYMWNILVDLHNAQVRSCFLQSWRRVEVISYPSTNP
jgi:hypothetical protein